ncbi:MAG: hypothetical protein ACJAZO_001553 [Myxococcota bacterium]|jgi:hypothetical protein
MLRSAVLLPALLLPLAASAQEYRRVSTIDGRDFIAEVVGSDESGFILRVLPGRLRLPYAELAGMEDSSEEAFDNQADWPVWVASTASARAGFVSAIRAIDGVAVIGVADTAASPALIAEAEACALDLGCATDVFAAIAPVWILRTTLVGGEAIFETNIAGTDFTNVVRSDRANPSAVGNAVYDALGIVPPEGVVIQLPEDTPDTTMVRPDVVGTEPDSSGTDISGTAPDTATTTSDTTAPDATDHSVTPPPPARGTWTRERVMASSFIPLPGYTSFAQGDTAGGLLSIVTVVPLTAAWTGVAGKTSQTSGEHVALSVGGFYVATVVANQVFGLNTQRRSVAASVAPVEGGAVIVFSGQH